MYKFTNGIVVFDEKTRDSYIKAGYRLVERVIKKACNGNSNKKPIGLDKYLNENSSNNGAIEEKPRKNNKTSK